MDCILGITTFLANANLVWSRGVWWSWLLWGLNACGWQVFAMQKGLWGLTPLNLVTIGIGFVTAWRRYWETHGERPSNE